MPQAFLVSERHRLREELSDRAVEREFTPQDGRSAAAAAGAATTTSNSSNSKVSSTGLQDGAAGAGAGAGGALGDFQRKITPEAMLAALEGPAAAAAAGGGGAEGDGGLAAALFGLGEEEDGDANWKWVAPCRVCVPHAVTVM